MIDLETIQAQAIHEALFGPFFDPEDKAPSSTSMQCRYAVQAIRAAAPPANEEGWRPIESAPKDGTPVLIAQRNKHDAHPQYDYWYIDTAENFYHIDHSDDAKDQWTARESKDVVCTAPTHWRPLPAPPSSEGA